MTLDDIARRLVARGIASEETVGDVLREVGDDAEPIPFLQAFVRRRALSASQFAEILREAGGEATLAAIPERRLGDYEILGEIGRGGMGVVHRARHRVLGREVALKTIAAGASETQLGRFLREGQALARLVHRSIVRVHDFGCEGDHWYLAMNIVEGDPLDRGIERRGLSRRKIVALYETIARALHVAHEAGVIHRDLKPANVRIDPEGNPVLLDFGLARFEDDETRGGLTRTGEALGTPFYMSPEQFRGAAGEIDRRTDVYALGVMLYQSLTGRLPYQAATAVALYDKIMNEDPPRPRRLDSTIHPALEAVCLRAMARASGDRYPTALELAEDLARSLAGQPVTTTLRRRRGRRSLGRVPARFALFLGLGIGLAAWGAFALFSGPPPSTDPGPPAPDPVPPAPDDNPIEPRRLTSDEFRREAEAFGALDEILTRYASKGSPSPVELLARLQGPPDPSAYGPFLVVEAQRRLRAGEADVVQHALDLAGVTPIPPSRELEGVCTKAFGFAAWRYAHLHEEGMALPEIQDRLRARRSEEPGYALVALAAIDLARGSWREAEALLDPAIEQGRLEGEVLVTAYYRRSMTRRELGRHAEALEDLRAAYDREGRFAWCDGFFHDYNVSAYAAFAENDLERGLRAFEWAVAANRSNAMHNRTWSLIYRAEYLEKLGRLEAALAGFDQAFAVDPGHFEVHWRRAFFHERRGDIDKALADWREVEARSRDLPDAAAEARSQRLRLEEKLREGG